jgi:hypothetical protein
VTAYPPDAGARPTPAPDFTFVSSAIVAPLAWDPLAFDALAAGAA